MRLTKSRTTVRLICGTDRYFLGRSGNLSGTRRRSTRALSENVVSAIEPIDVPASQIPQEIHRAAPRCGGAGRL
jgi:hypothetical protein